jgi:carnitine-CoA ligase
MRLNVGRVPGEVLDPAELIAFLRPRMAHFMLPRFIRIIEELPKAPTQKIQRHILCSEGVTPDTWDREKAGIHVRREKLSDA